MTGRHTVAAGEVGKPTRDLPLGIGSRSPMGAALAYGAAGWPVLPVAGASAGECACKRSCESPGKHPITRHGVHDATTDPVLIGEWWHRSPGANVGIATGVASGLVVVDLDPYPRQRCTVVHTPARRLAHPIGPDDADAGVGRAREQFRCGRRAPEQDGVERGEGVDRRGGALVEDLGQLARHE